MANAHVMFCKVEDGIPVITVLGSATVASAAASSAAPSGTSFVRVHALTAAMYAQVGGDASASPRASIGVDGSVDLKCVAGQTVGVRDV